MQDRLNLLKGHAFKHNLLKGRKNQLFNLKSGSGSATLKTATENHLLMVIIKSAKRRGRTT